jgi:bla regulator protein blaR1
MLALSTLLLLLVPWNPLLWWHSHRLRLAIEVDCDRRVLRSGFEMKRYAEVLIQFGLRRANLLGATASISESPSTLERRITLMFQPKKAHWTLASVALALLSIGSVAAATRITPPPLRLAAATAISEASPSDSYVCSYEFASVTILNIERERDQLSAIFPNQSADQLSPLRPDEYRYKEADVTIRFKRDTAGQVMGLSFEQNGAATYAPRIASTRVQAIQSQIAERYRRQLAAPGSEQALRVLIAGLQSGSPDYSMMSPQLAGGTRTMLKSFQGAMQPFGSIQSIEFQGVNKAGWDQYHVKHAHGTADWQISLDDKRVVVGALVNPDS